MIDRLSEYINYKGISVSSFESSIGASDGMLRRAISKNTDIQSKWITAISENYHDINLIWLITGKGEMLLDVDDKKYTPKYTPVDQKAELELPREATMSVAHPVERGGIPLIPIEAAAGALSGSGLQALDFECEYYVIPSFKNAEFMIRITGDSMIPKYQAGDIVACQRLSLGTFFQWNNVYVVDSEQGALIKRIKRGSDKEHILLVSENRDYEPFELSLSEINGLGQVVGIVRLE